MKSPKDIEKDIFEKKSSLGWRGTFASKKEEQDYFNDSVKHFEKTLYQQGISPKQKFTTRKLLSIAATLLVLVSASSWLFFQNTNHPVGPYFEEYFEKLPYAKTGVVRGADESAAYSEQPTLQAAIKAYRQDDYQNAIRLFENHLLVHPEDIENRLYFALSMIHYNPSRAERELKIVSKEALSPEIKETAVWYRALALIKNNKSDDACALLRSYVSPMSDFLHIKRNSFLEKCRHD